jgi:hypothetical protein
MEIRGLLCRACNTLLGQLENRMDTIERALKYLDKSQ